MRREGNIFKGGEADTFVKDPLEPMPADATALRFGERGCSANEGGSGRGNSGVR